MLLCIVGNCLLFYCSCTGNCENCCGINGNASVSGGINDKIEMRMIKRKRWLRREEKMMKSKSFIYKIILVLVLIVICFIMIYIGRWHTLYFDNKSMEIAGTNI